jgi:hypothetical protein
VTSDPHAGWPSTSGCSNPPEESCSDAGCPIHGDQDGNWDYADQQAAEGITGMYWDNLGHGAAQ